jgi:hypothetical protein
MKDQGWIKVHRKIEKSRCWNHSLEMRSVFLTCLLRPNHKRKHWEKQVIEPGEFITSLSKMAKMAKVSVSQVRTCFRHLTNWQQIRAQNIANKMTKVTICNWKTYQDLPQTDCTEDRNQIATNKNDKNDSEQEESSSTGNSGKYSESFSVFQKAHPSCRLVPEMAFILAIRTFEPEVDVDEALQAFSVDMAGATYLPHPIREFKKYLRRSGSKILEKKAAAASSGSGESYVPSWKRTDGDW